MKRIFSLAVVGLATFGTLALGSASASAATQPASVSASTTTTAASAATALQGTVSAPLASPKPDTKGPKGRPVPASTTSPST
nr:hypothetical protein GCM10020093_117330 [Planobispora longispora]BFE89373.1 hypothetical protein GCM10020093_119750 [Planobispora longispora]